MLSTAIASATPEEWFHRCAGDFKQVKNSANLPGDQGLWRGRQWFGVLGNLDETYDFLTAFGLLSDETTKSTKASTKVNPHQSALNKLLQFGSAARATKTSGSYGDSSGNGISLGVVGNMHPATYVPMERSETGAHHAATKERFLICSGRPVQPHEDLPADYPLPPGEAGACVFGFLRDLVLTTQKHFEVPLFAVCSAAMRSIRAPLGALDSRRRGHAGRRQGSPVARSRKARVARCISG